MARTRLDVVNLVDSAQIEGVGTTDVEIAGAAGLDDATAGQVTFLANPRYTPRLKTTRASAVYAGENVEVDRHDIVVLRAKDPYLAYTRALRVFYPEARITGFIHPSAVIDPTATIAEQVWIGAAILLQWGAWRLLNYARSADPEAEIPVSAT